jgi:anti-sigma B factor antagonist
MKFEFKVEELNEIVIIHFIGSIFDKSEATDLLTSIDDYLEKGTNKFIVNLSQIDYMNSSGLGILINILTKSRNKYGELVVCEIPDKVVKLLVTSKLKNIFKITESQDLAIEKLNK